MARVSVFKELGLTIDEPEERSDLDTIASSLLRSPAESSSQGTHDDRSSRGWRTDTDTDTGARKRWYRRIWSRLSFVRPRLRPGSPLAISPAAFPTLTHVVMLVLLFLIVLPGLRLSVPIGRARYAPPLAYAGVIGVPSFAVDVGEPAKRLEARANSPTDTCVRWSHQCGSRYPWVTSRRNNFDEIRCSGCRQRDSVPLRWPIQNKARTEIGYVE